MIHKNLTINQKEASTVIHKNLTTNQGNPLYQKGDLMRKVLYGRYFYSSCLLQRFHSRDTRRNPRTRSSRMSRLHASEQ